MDDHPTLPGQSSSQSFATGLQVWEGKEAAFGVHRKQENPEDKNVSKGGFASFFSF